MSFRGQIFYIFNEELETTTTTTTSTTTTTTTLGTISILATTILSTSTVSPPLNQAGDYLLAFIMGVNATNSSTVTAPSTPSQTGWTELFNQTSGAFNDPDLPAEKWVNMRCIVYGLSRGAGAPSALNNMTINGSVNSKRAGVILRVRRSIGSISSVNIETFVHSFRTFLQTGNLTINTSYRTTQDAVVVFGFGAANSSDNGPGAFTLTSTGFDTDISGQGSNADYAARGHFGSAPATSSLTWNSTNDENAIHFGVGVSIRFVV